MAKASEIDRLNDLLAARAFGQALSLADNLTAASPRDAAAWFGRARAAFGLGRLRAADESVDRAQIGRASCRERVL